MNAKKRYTFIILSVIFFAICHFWGTKFRRRKLKLKNSNSYLKQREILFERRTLSATSEISKASTYSSSCTMSTCFDMSKCAGKAFKVYVYPLDENVLPSSSYMKIINALKDSHFYTSNPMEACMFVLSLDTLDRDPLSQDFVRNMQARVENLDYWNNGLNHIVFTLYSGTWAEYTGI